MQVLLAFLCMVQSSSPSPHRSLSMGQTYSKTVLCVKKIVLSQKPWQTEMLRSVICQVGKVMFLMQLYNETKALAVCRCLSCDTDLRAQRGMQQQGRRSPPPSKPSLLPKLLALDPSSAALYSALPQAPDTGVHA